MSTKQTVPEINAIEDSEDFYIAAKEYVLAKKETKEFKEKKQDFLHLQKNAVLTTEQHIKKFDEQLDGIKSLLVDDLDCEDYMFDNGEILGDIYIDVGVALHANP